MSAKDNGKARASQWGIKVRLYYKEKRQQSINNRESAINDNYWLKKEGLPTVRVLPVYTWENFANELGCNVNTLRRFAGGHGEIDADIIGNFLRLAKQEQVIEPPKLEIDGARNLPIPYSRLTPCGCPCGCRGHFIKTGGNNYRCFDCRNCKRKRPT